MLLDCCYQNSNFKTTQLIYPFTLGARIIADVLDYNIYYLIIENDKKKQTQKTGNINIMSS